MSYVFLSHSHADKAFTRKVAADLRNAGHGVWIDEAEIRVGDSLINKITAGLSQVDYVAAVLSKNSIESVWVDKELEIASNRELSEKRVIVLPILFDDVALPGFLQGKLYADFRQEENYHTGMNALLEALGPVEATPQADQGELDKLREELAAVRAMVDRQKVAIRRAEETAFESKSDALKAAIEEANKKFPQHAPINRTYAFEFGNTIVTLDYALWAVAKSVHKGYHVLEALLTISNRWSDIERMFEAYEDMLVEQGKG